MFDYRTIEIDVDTDPCTGSIHLIAVIIDILTYVWPTQQKTIKEINQMLETNKRSGREYVNVTFCC